MLHPLFSQARTLYIYICGWLAIAILQGLVLFQLSCFSATTVVIDTAIYNIVLLILSFSFWFPLRYADKNKKLLSQIINNATVYLIYVAIWMLAGWVLSMLVLSDEHGYRDYSLQIIWFRALWGGLLMLLIAVLYHTFDFYQNLEEKKQQHEQLQRLVKETELKALKSQLNPHFLFNSLNSVSALTITDPAAAREMINKLSDFMRYSLRHNDQSMLPLGEELQNMNRYLDIEKVRFGNRLNTITQVNNDLLSMKVPAMILQPLYENAVKHGVYESIDPVTISTYCQMHHDMLEITVTNNYDPESVSPKGEGVGLANIRHRMRLLFQSESLFTTSHQNNQFKATLLIPQKTLA